MPFKQVISIIVIFQMITMLIFLQGCSRVLKVDIKPVSLSKSQEKINIDVVFVHTNELEEYSYKFPLPVGSCSKDVILDKLIFKENPDVDISYRYSICAKGIDVKEAIVGNSLRKDTEIVLKNIFNNATTLHVQGDDHFTDNTLDHQPYKEMVPPNTVGILKLQSPEVNVFYDCKKPWINASNCEIATELTAQWVLNDLDNNRIWSSRIAGYGNSKSTSFFSGPKTLAEKQAQIAIDNHFTKLANALQKAPEIRLIESCLRVGCNSLLNNPSSIYEKLKKIENIQERKQIAQRLIYMAIEKGNIGLLKELLSTNYIDVNRADEYYQVLPIHLAAKSNNLEAIKLLINSKSDINTDDNNGWTPLHYAAYNGSTEITKLLIQKGADIEAKNSEGHTPFFLAITYGHKNDWQLLIDNGADYYKIGEDDLKATALKYIKTGYYFAEKNDRVKSTETLKLASENFEKASLFYSDLSKRAGTKALTHEIIQIVLLTVYQLGAQYQAQQRAEQYAEFKALNDAQKMGLSQIQTLDLTATYKTAASSSTGTSVHINPIVPIGNKLSISLREIETDYSKLSETCHILSGKVQNILICYEERGIMFKECIKSLPLQ